MRPAGRGTLQARQPLGRSAKAPAPRIWRRQTGQGRAPQAACSALRRPEREALTAPFVLPDPHHARGFAQAAHGEGDLGRQPRDLSKELRLLSLTPMPVRLHHTRIVPGDRWPSREADQACARAHRFGPISKPCRSHRGPDSATQHRCGDRSHRPSDRLAWPSPCDTVCVRHSSIIETKRHCSSEAAAPPCFESRRAEPRMYDAFDAYPRTADVIDLHLQAPARTDSGRGRRSRLGRPEFTQPRCWRTGISRPAGPYPRPRCPSLPKPETPQPPWRLRPRRIPSTAETKRGRIRRRRKTDKCSSRRNGSANPFRLPFTLDHEERLTTWRAARNSHHAARMTSQVNPPWRGSRQLAAPVGIHI